MPIESLSLAPISRTRACTHAHTHTQCMPHKPKKFACRRITLHDAPKSSWNHTRWSSTFMYANSCLGKTECCTALISSVSTRVIRCSDSHHSPAQSSSLWSCSCFDTPQHSDYSIHMLCIRGHKLGIFLSQVVAHSIHMFSCLPLVLLVALMCT